MDSVEANAKNVEDAIQVALKKLGASRDEVEIVVLSEGRSGILGLGAEDARVRVTLKEQEVPVVEAPVAPAGTEDVVAIAKEVLESLLKLMSVNANVEAKLAEADARDGTIINLDISGEDLGILIGRRGETLSSLQFISNLIVGKKTGYAAKVAVDVEGYRMRRADALRGLALRMAERVKQTQQAVTLEAMPPSERRVIHMTLADHPTSGDAQYR